MGSEGGLSVADIYSDENVSFDVVGGLRGRGHGVFTALDLGLGRADDDIHLLSAVQRGLVLLTCNRKDFVLLHGAWRRWSAAWRVAADHAGVIILPQIWPVGRAIRELDTFLASAPNLANTLVLWRADGGWTPQPDPVGGEETTPTNR